jgi:hypothetical protein
MTISKKLFLILILAIVNIVQSAIIEDRDYQTFYKYVDLAAQELIYIDEQLQHEKHGDREIMVSGQSYAEELYPRQKKMLKALSKFIKKTQNTVLYKKFKYEVYKQWKKTFKKNYKASIASGDDLWGWLHVRCNFPIEE